MKKKIITAVMTLLTTFSLTSCGEGSSKYDTCLNHLKTHLKDPSSVMIDGATGYKSKQNDGSYVYGYAIRYNAKNSYGAYVGATTAYVVISQTSGTSCSVCNTYAQAFYYLCSTSGEKIYEK